MNVIPAICGNSKCGAIFPSPFTFDEGMQVVFEGIETGPCLKCGRSGHILDGKYNAIAGQLSVHLSQLVDIKSLLRLITTIESAIESKEFKTAKSELQKESPKWHYVWSLLPEENIGDAIAIYMFVLALIQTAIALYSLSKKPSAPAIINQSVNLFYESQLKT